MAKAVIEIRGVWEGIGRWEQVTGGKDVRFSQDYDVRRWNVREPVGEVLFTIPRGTKAKAWGEAGYNERQGYADTNKASAILCVEGIDADMPMCRDSIDGVSLANRGYVVPIDYLESYDGSAYRVRVVILGEPDRGVEPQVPETHTITIDGQEAVVEGPLEDGRLFTMMQGGMLRAFMEVTREDGTVEVVPANTPVPDEDLQVEPDDEQAVEADPDFLDYEETDEYRLGDPRED